MMLGITLLGDLPRPMKALEASDLSSQQLLTNALMPPEENGSPSGNGDFSMYYTRVTDPLIASFLALRRSLGHPPPIPRLLKLAPALRTLYTSLPLAPNLSDPVLSSFGCISPAYARVSEAGPAGG